MADKKLSNNQVHDRLVAASVALGDTEAATTLGTSTMAAAKRVLATLALGLIVAEADDSDQNRAIKGPAET